MTFSTMLRVTVLSAATLFLFSACDDWTSGTKSNSSSSGKVGDFNLTNVYEGQLSGGRAVSSTSAGRITRFNIQQSGSSLLVIDNQGSRYEGFIGNGTTQRDNTTPPRATSGSGDDDGGNGDNNSNITSLGRLVTTYPVNFRGFDQRANRNIEFAGVIEVVTQSEFVAGGFTFDPTTGQILGREIVESVQTTLVLRGTWVETGGRVSNVLARTSTETTTLPPVEQPAPAPAPAPAP